MTLEECYQKLGGNYADAKNRMMSDKLVERFVLKFPADASMQHLLDAVAAGQHAEAFRAVHTLKGVAANLAFTELQAAASALTEQMRACDVPADAALLQAVKQCYQLTIETLEVYNNEK